MVSCSTHVNHLVLHRPEGEYTVLQIRNRAPNNNMGTSMGEYRTDSGYYPPQPPDFLYCDVFYGYRLNVDQCMNAVSQLPRGLYPVPWFRSGSGRGPYILPFQRSSGKCSHLKTLGRISRLTIFSYDIGSMFVTVEVSGPRPPPTIVEVPDDIYHLAAFLCQSCVKTLGKGGFVTHGFRTTIEWAQDESPPFAWRAFPSMEATFFTITISGPSNKQYCPGSTDPVIALALGSAVVGNSDPNDPQDEVRNKKKKITLD